MRVCTVVMQHVVDWIILRFKPKQITKRFNGSHGDEDKDSILGGLLNLADLTKVENEMERKVSWAWLDLAAVKNKENDGRQ
jgi:hypothetical protein